MKNQLESCIKGYIEDYQTALSLDETMIHPMSYEQWKNGFENRSLQLRKIYRKNKERIGLIVQLSATLVDFTEDNWLGYTSRKELAEELFEAVRMLYTDSCDDYYIFQLLCKPLIGYYEEVEGLAECVELYSMMSFESYHFYGQISGEEKNLKSTVEYCQKIVDLEDKFDLFASEKTFRYFMLAYSNLISPLSQYDLSVREKMFDIYSKANDFYHKFSHYQKEIDPAELYYRLDIPLLSSEAWITSLSDSEVQMLCDIVRKLAEAEDYADTDGNLYRTKQTLAIHFKEKNSAEVIKEYIDFIHQLPEPNYENEEEGVIFNEVINYFNTAWNIFEIFDNFDISEKEQKEYASDFVGLVTRVLTQVPYNFMTSVFHEVCSLWYSRASLYLSSFEEKDQLLKKMILCRQPSTYIHSQMVKELAVLIASEMMERQSDYFGEYPGKEEALSFIGEGALLHDIGKCAIVGVVNTQFRALSDTEFNLIRLHPEKALQIIYRNSDFDQFIDVMLGHHKTYDESFGYPVSFDHQKSSLAHVIDLISICDAMDAATDFYGRNYASGKDFAKLIDELVRDKGKRYNPELVNLIVDNRSLYEKLRVLTEETRSEVCYQVFLELLNIKK